MSETDKKDITIGGHTISLPDIALSRLTAADAMSRIVEVNLLNNFGGFQNLIKSNQNLLISDLQTFHVDYNSFAKIAQKAMNKSNFEHIRTIQASNSFLEHLKKLDINYNAPFANFFLENNFSENVNDKDVDVIKKLTPFVKAGWLVGKDCLNSGVRPNVNSIKMSIDARLASSIPIFQILPSVYAEASLRAYKNGEFLVAYLFAMIAIEGASVEYATKPMLGQSLVKNAFGEPLKNKHKFWGEAWLILESFWGSTDYKSSPYSSKLVRHTVAHGRYNGEVKESDAVRAVAAMFFVDDWLPDLIDE